MQVVKELIASFNIIDSTDNQGNTALHVAAYRGQLAVVEALIIASPSCIHTKNNAGETFLHMAVTGFQTPSFRRLDRQIELMKQLLFGNVFSPEEIINAKNNEGRTALHLAIIANMHSDLVKLLMTVRPINVNVRDINGMTPLDLLKQRPRSASSEILMRQLLSAGGIFGSEGFSRIAASNLKRQSIGDSPGTSFRISDTEIFLYTGIEGASDAGGSASRYNYSTEPIQVQQESTMETRSPRKNKQEGNSVNHAAAHLKRLLHLPKMKGRKPERLKIKADQNLASKTEETPISLRQRYSNSTPRSLANNKRTLAVRSNLSSPNAKKKLASGLKERSRSSSFSKSSVSSSDKQTGLYFESENEGDLCGGGRIINDGGSTSSVHKQHGFIINKRLMNQCFCFGASGVPVKAPAGRPQQESYDHSVLSVG